MSSRWHDQLALALLQRLSSRSTATPTRRARQPEWNQVPHVTLRLCVCVGGWGAYLGAAMQRVRADYSLHAFLHRAHNPIERVQRFKSVSTALTQ